MSMKFIKGMMLGTAVSAGIALMYKGDLKSTKRKMMKKGRQAIRKMGII